MDTSTSIAEGRVTTSNAVVHRPEHQPSQTQISTVQTVRGPIMVDQIRVSLKRNPDGKPNRETAQLRQVTYRHYPSGKIGNSHQDSLFDQSDFGFEDRVAESTRMAFIDVPVDTTREQIEAMLAEYPEACIYQVLSDQPILTDTQLQAIEAGLITIEDVAFGRPGADGKRTGGQLVRYGKSASIPEGKTPQDWIPGPSGKMQFRQTFFSRTHKEDIDLRKRVASQGAQSFTREEASEYNRTHMTRDQQMHEGKVTVAGQNKSVTEHSDQEGRTNDFAGTITRGEQAQGNMGKPAARAGFPDNPDIISNPDHSGGSAAEASTETKVAGDKASNPEDSSANAQTPGEAKPSDPNDNLEDGGSISKADTDKSIDEEINQKRNEDTGNNE